MYYIHCPLYIVQTDNLIVLSRKILQCHNVIIYVYLRIENQYYEILKSKYENSLGNLVCRIVSLLEINPLLADISYKC